MSAARDDLPRDDDARWVRGGHDMGSVTDLVAGAVAPARTRKSWLLMLLVTFAGVGVLFVSVLWLFSEYVGIWGIEIPVAWGIAIASFVWWIGIGHAGTLISAVLLLAKPRYYMDPSMKNGYCKGSQVFHHVRDVIAMYEQLKARRGRRSKE